jgi:hypothetical protein
MSTPRRLSRGLGAALTAGLLALSGPWPTIASAAGGPDIAAGDPAAASSSHGEYRAANITDGQQATYWQSAGSDLPQWVQTDLGGTHRVDEVVLRLPASWERRSQTLSVQGSADGTGFTTLKASAAYSFDPGSGNTVTVSFPATQTRFVRIAITANTGWQAAQLSDVVIDNIWNEHMVCLYWGANTDRMTIKNSRIRNMFADGINMTNGSTDNLVSNNDARATGDDSFALFSAIDAAAPT